MRRWLEQVIAELNWAGSNWAELFVLRRMEFHRRFSAGLIFSTVHGADFFNNVLDCLNGASWRPDKDHTGSYEENFRRMIRCEREKENRLVQCDGCGDTFPMSGVSISEAGFFLCGGCRD